ncbi:hypothetical protein GCM10023094_12580 [Rhodococcus olei]|uniref:RES domain-containing protein n=1 Tax=Rhodococcus olei TaxID=2161675 RepID=A0ABP8NVV0_9NOCA
MTNPGQSQSIDTSAGPLHCTHLGGELIHRVGYAPNPWAWTPWQYAEDGRFNGRWDDPDGNWRTLYVGASRLACYLEVLAFARADPRLALALADIDEDPDDAAAHPTASAGALPKSWCEPRAVATGAVTGWYALPGHHESLPTLRSRFLSLALHHGLADVDAAAVRDSRPRALTQAISGWLYLQQTPDGDDVAGVQFQSRHGDGLDLWAVYERPLDPAISPRLTPMRTDPVRRDDPDLVEAMRIHRLQWAP